jgi:hypothetical protein
LKPLDGAHAAGARIILTARNPERLQRTAKEIDALSTAAFDATDFKLLKRFFDDRSAHLLLRLQIARDAANKVRPGGTLLFMGAPAMTRNLSLVLARPSQPHRAGLVDTPLSAQLLGDELENRRNQLRSMLPIRRVVEASDVAALALHIMKGG